MIRAAASRHRRLFACVIVWYAAALLLTAGNKLLLDILQFPYPIFATFIHFAGVGVLMTVINRTRLKPGRAVDIKFIKSSFVKDLLPISIFTAMEVALTNQSYSLVSLSVLTTVKSTVVAATYVVSILFDLERFSWKLALSLVWIIASVALSLPGMESSSAWGVGIVVLAVVCASFRWVLVQKEIQRNNFPIDSLISITQPLAAICLLPAAIIFDGTRLLQNYRIADDTAPPNFTYISSFANGVEWFVIICLLLLVSTLLVTVLLYLEFKVVEDSSSLTLCVIGTGRECLTVAMSMIIFKEYMRLRGWLGLISSICGILYYAYLRAMAEQQRAVYEYELEKAGNSMTPVPLSKNTSASSEV